MIVFTSLEIFFFVKTIENIVKRAIYLNHVCNGSFHTEYKSMFNIL